MAKKNEYTEEELVNMKVFTIMQAQAYVEKKLGMGRALFFDCVRPLLNPKPVAKNYRKKKNAHLVVTKKEVDKVIARMKRKLVD